MGEADLEHHFGNPGQRPGGQEARGRARPREAARVAQVPEGGREGEGRQAAAEEGRQGARAAARIAKNGQEARREEPAARRRTCPARTRSSTTSSTPRARTRSRRTSRSASRATSCSRPRFMRRDKMLEAGQGLRRPRSARRRRAASTPPSPRSASTGRPGQTPKTVQLAGHAQARRRTRRSPPARRVQLEVTVENKGTEPLKRAARVDRERQRLPRPPRVPLRRLEAGREEDLDRRRRAHRGAVGALGQQRADRRRQLLLLLGERELHQSTSASSRSRCTLGVPQADTSARILVIQMLRSSSAV